MNVLLIAGGLPYPPASGGALRVFSLIQVLHGAGHTVSLIALDDSAADWQSTPLKHLCAQVAVIAPPLWPKSRRLINLLRGQADIAQRMAVPDVAVTALRWHGATPFDLIQAEGIETAFALRQLASQIGDTVLSFDTFNAEYALQRVIAGIDARTLKRWPAALYSWIQSHLIRRYERALCQLSQIVIAVSPEDAAALQPLCKTGQSVPVIPSAIDTAIYAEAANPADLGSKALVFTGKMDYRPNVDAMLWFCDAIWPQIRQTHPEATLIIVGQRPSPAIQALSALPGVTVTGRVESVTPYLHAATVYIAPLRMGSGTRLKLLEAMAASAPIVATPIAAAGLLPAAKAAMIATPNTAEAFASAVNALLNNPNKRSELANEALHCVRTHYDWRAVAPALLRIYEEAGLG
jgi:glycosyltransferase involved in cell wall biosynthesis